MGPQQAKVESAESDFSKASSEALRERYFDETKTGQSDRGFVSRRVALYVKRFWQGHRQCLADLFQETYADIWDRFESILEKFKEAPPDKPPRRPQTFPSFEAFLSTAIRNSAISQMRKLSRCKKDLGSVHLGAVCEEPQSDTPDPSQMDQYRQEILKGWHGKALQALTQLEKRLLRARLVDGASCDELARREGLKPNVLYKRLWKAKLKFKTEIVRSAGEHFLATHPQAVSRFRPLVEHRCEIEHPCYMFARSCAKARQPAEIAVRIRTGQTAQELADDLEAFYSTINETLDNWGLATNLTSCFHAL